LREWDLFISECLEIRRKGNSTRRPEISLTYGIGFIDLVHGESWLGSGGIHSERSTADLVLVNTVRKGKRMPARMVV